MPALTTSLEEGRDGEGDELATGVPHEGAAASVHADQPESSVAAVQIAVLQAELRDVRAQRDALRDRVAALERSAPEHADDTLDARPSGLDARSDKQAIIQRYERIIAEKEAAIERARSSSNSSTDGSVGVGDVVAAVRDVVSLNR